MALDLGPLEDTLLTDGIRRAIAPGPMQKMAARGLAPLPPPDLVTALYMLAEPWRVPSEGDPLPEVAVDARKTVAGMPDGLLAGVVALKLDARVLDFVARQLVARPKLIQALLLNRAVADETFAHLASVCAEAELAMIARNEDRLLRAPQIIAALYLNKRTPMSMAVRAVELAVRNGVVVDIPQFDEIRAQVQGGHAELAKSGAEDAPFKQAALEEVIDDVADLGLEGDLSDEELEELVAHDESMVQNGEKKTLRITELSIPAKVRLAFVGNSFARSVLIRDSNRPVYMAAISSPQVSDNEMLKYAANRGLPEDVIRFIAGKRSSLRLYSMKVALLFNPKTPLPTAMGFLNFLTLKDLRAVAKSKAIPAPLVRAGQQLLTKKNQK